MSRQPLVRIYLPSFESPDTLSIALRSVERQSHGNWYLHLVDDGSSDGSAEICREFANRFPERVEAVCLARNRGLRWSLNRFLSRARPGELLAFFSHDDEWMPGHLEKAATALESEPLVCLVYSDGILIDRSGDLLGETFANRWGEAPRDEQFVESLVRNGNHVCGPAVVARADAVLAAGLRIPRTVRLCTDYYMWLVLAAEFSVRFLAGSTCRYRVSSTQLTNRSSRTQREQFEVLRLVYRRSASLRRQIPASEAREHLVRTARMYLQARRVEGKPAEALFFGLRLLELEPTAEAAKLVVNSMYSAWRGRRPTAA